MASDHPSVTATNVELSPSATPGYTHANGLTGESAKKASELLTANHALYHTRWSALGFHIYHMDPLLMSTSDQITHHLLALWALGASPEQIQEMFDYNTPYQVSMRQPDGIGAAHVDMVDTVVFDECLGKNEFYKDYLQYFENEITKKGMKAVVKQYVLKGDERANDIFCRMFTDMGAAMIHLGCGLEFQQSSVVAEALASACVHDDWPKSVLLPTEEFVRSNVKTPTKPLLQVLESLRSDPVVAAGVKASDPFNKIRDGLLKRVPKDHLVPYLSQFQVKSEAQDLEQKLGDMMQTCAYMTGAAQQPDKLEAIDYVLLHSVTLSVHYAAILALDWLSDDEKARLLEAKGRMDALTYAGCGSPRLHPERISAYVPKYPNHGWPELFQRAVVYRDEGHVAKLIRSLYALEQLDETTMMPELPIRKPDFVKIAHMVLDSTERLANSNSSMLPDKVADAIASQVGLGGEMVVNNRKRWVFYCGLDQAWQFFPDL
ncbi:uncharacterized protein BDR25DRAFT_379416 [Lindgomyces ingoldianus]|uniref:Uncharacterized protein n=1 Tax=Lindgomyces ingoldianus TaxID=673940 RepID=A0ACB6R942_9PLEO|nr:uncharacterized protein BDR25DRAFT_379416 [Lindgomyces ingoldianus]KAF2475849.1 hypothetical protein BDR25DRAFT_379416 [Lindgomyces ingoldianus]